MEPNEITRLQDYLRMKFGCQRIKVTPRQDTEASAEVALGDEFIGVIFRDDEDGDVCYQFNMTILDIDLDPS